MLTWKWASLTVRGVETNELNSNIWFQFACKDIDVRNKIFYKLEWAWGEIDYTTVGESLPIDNNRTEEITKFDPFSISMTELCRGDEYTNLRIVFFGWDRKGKHKELGIVNFSLYDITTEKIWDYKIYSAKSIVGTFYVLKYEITAKYTFMDYIFAGCDVGMVVGIDFTLDST